MARASPDAVAPGESLRQVAGGWLVTMEKAMAALGQGGAASDRQLVEVAVRGLAAAATAAEEAPVATAAAMLLRLLSYRIGGDGSQPQAPSDVQEAAYERLLQLLTAVDSSALGNAVAPGPRGVVRLVLAQPTLELLATAGLSAPATRRAAAQVLLEALRAGGAEAAAAVLGWHAWVECHRGDPDVSCLVDCLDACSDHSKAPRQSEVAATLWTGRVATLVRGLFSRAADERARAGRALLAVVAPEVAEEAAREEAAGRGEFK
jgi:hypothetical protein